MTRPPSNFQVLVRHQRVREAELLHEDFPGARIEFGGVGFARFEIGHERRVEAVMCVEGGGRVALEEDAVIDEVY